MTAISYYRWSLLLPIPVLILAATSPLSGNPLLFITLLAGIMPYAAWAIYALIRLRVKDEDEARRMSWWAPLQMMLLSWLVAAIIGTLTGVLPRNATWASLSHQFLACLLVGVLYGTPTTLVIGYFCVGAVNGSLKLAKRWGVVSEAKLR